MARPALLLAFALFWSAGMDAKVSFNWEVRPILSEQCFSCHGFDAKHRKADLRLDTREGALADNDGVRAIIPGDPAKSELWKRLLSQDPEEVMPPPEAHKPKLTAKQLATLRTWIEEGAPYEPHWAFTSPMRPALKEKGPAAVDALIDQRLKDAGLTASHEASPDKLLRRLSLDLTGLPPTPAELAAFAQARSKDPQAAYDDAVERLPRVPGFTTSPWAVGDKIFCLDEEGQTHVLRAGEKFELLHTNPSLDSEMCMATPELIGDRLLVRTDRHLYSIRNSSRQP